MKNLSSDEEMSRAALYCTLHSKYNITVSNAIMNCVQSKQISKNPIQYHADYICDVIIYIQLNLA